MNNPIYNALNTHQAIEDGGFADIIQQAQQLKQNIKGNPQQIVQNLLNTGAMSQSQFNQYSQMANRIVAAMQHK